MDLFLYRPWTMLLTSLMGVLLAGHAGVLLIEQSLKVDTSDWVARNVAALNGLVVGLVVLGILLQSVSAPDTEAEDEPKEVVKEEEESAPAPPPPKPAKPASWWKKLITPRKAA